MGIFSGTVLKDMKVATKQKTILSAKNKKSISEPNFTKSEQKVHFGQFFFENDPLREKNPISLRKWSKSPNGDQIRIYHSLQNYSGFKKGFETPKPIMQYNWGHV